MTDPVAAWRRRRWAVRLVGTVVTLGLLAVGLQLWRALTPPPTVTRVAVPAAPSPHVRRFGRPASTTTQAEIDTGQALLDPEVLPAIDGLRAAGAWCGDPVGRLAGDERLREAAAAQAAWLAASGARAHRTPGSPVGRSPAERARAYGYGGAVGEVLAWGHGSGLDAVAWWEGSETHCPVVLDPSWVAVGAAWHDGVWVVLFGDR